MEVFGPPKNFLVQLATCAAGTVEAISTIGGLVAGKVLVENPLGGAVIGALLPVVGLGILLVLNYNSKSR